MTDILREPKGTIVSRSGYVRPTFNLDGLIRSRPFDWDSEGDDILTHQWLDLSRGVIGKGCYRCGCIKLLDAFYKDGSRAGGYDNRCRECSLIISEERRRAKGIKPAVRFTPEQRAANRAAYNANPVNRTKTAAYQREYLSDPVRRARHNASQVKRLEDPRKKVQAKACAYVAYVAEKRTRADKGLCIDTNTFKVMRRADKSIVEACSVHRKALWAVIKRDFDGDVVAWEIAHREGRAD